MATVVIAATATTHASIVGRNRPPREDLRCSTARPTTRASGSRTAKVTRLRPKLTRSSTIQRITRAHINSIAANVPSTPTRRSPATGVPIHEPVQSIPYGHGSSRSRGRLHGICGSADATSADTRDGGRRLRCRQQPRLRPHQRLQPRIRACAGLRPWTAPAAPLSSRPVTPPADPAAGRGCHPRPAATMCHTTPGTRPPG